MNKNSSIKQYAFVRDTREALLSYCESLPWKDIVSPVEAFPGSSMRSHLVHVTNVYRYWLSRIGLQSDLPFFDPEAATDFRTIRGFYDETNASMDVFVSKHESKWDDELEWFVPTRKITIKAMPFKIFTHVITHEFHHKGQILTMSRLLGHTPPDTDLIRF